MRRNFAAFVALAFAILGSSIVSTNASAQAGAQKAGAQKTNAQPASAPQASVQQASTQQASVQTAVGQWLVHWEIPAKLSHGGTAPPQEIHGRVTLRQIGDSIFGAWQYSAPASEPQALANELRGVLNHDTVSVNVIPAVDPDASTLGSIAHDISEWMREHVHGISPTMTLYEFTVHGDSLNGVRRVVTVDGSVKDRVFPLSGVRVKSN